ncbi:Hachiman antiphage defense system protein HamA [Acetivibrio sp. MSJd-27]|uniref:Hachiman antiphage defense system protein HamA n=1 Tax=Acetivibrio sp. MSJd-27 TaxID=2841523 RepID=UPI001C1170A9|nr:Hachiman antiphage defense system protein HamA [Acetivibrio sp. MSJd-27]MBU5451439.1 DUF1837 domain-containing protein [Acetivibrio sp. MSJd-27]
MDEYTKSEFNDFEVISINEKTSFVHINLSESESFYKEIFYYFFSEDRILKYAENKNHLSFSPNKKNYAILYRELAYFIDEYNTSRLPQDIENEVLKILNDEYEIGDDGKGNLNIRLDKMGKIGGYIFCNLLSEYFKFECIIPKVHLTTDYNMSVYGIDALYYSPERDMILFGESKLSRSLSNGVGLLKQSLKLYEQQIRDEFSLVLSNRLLKDNMGTFGAKYLSAIETSIKIEDFIADMGIKKISVPLFVAHGTENTADEIFKTLSCIKKTDLLGLETQYILISLPIMNKSKMISVFTQCIAERRAFYEKQSASM